MPNNRTYDQLLALFLDNDDGDISAGDGRDLIATTFGYASSGDPSADNDSVDSAGIGQFFSIGSKWLNTTTQVVWRCWSGAVHMAVWQPEYNGVPPPPPSGPMLGKLTAGPAANPNCAISGVTGNATSGSDIVTGISGSDVLQLEPGMEFNPATGFPGVTTIVAVDQAGNQIQVGTNATSSGSVTFTATPIHYEWVEQTPGTVTSAPSDKPGGIVGTYSTAPAKNVTGLPIIASGQQVEVWLRGEASGIPVYEFEALLSAGTGGVSSPVPITTPAVTVGTPAAGDPALTTPGSVYIQPVTNLLVFVDIGGNPQVLLLGESGVDVPLLIDIDYTMFSGSSNTTIDLLTLAPKQYIRSIAFELTSLWTYSFGGTSDMQIGYDNADLTPAQNLAFFGQFRVMQSGTSTPIHHVAAGPNPGPLSANTAASWKLQATLTGFLGAPSAGHLKLWAWIGILP